MALVRTDKKVLVLSDVHAPIHHMGALKVVADFKKCFKPTQTLALGDWIDAAAISSFARDIEAFDTLHEFDVCNELLDEFLEPGDVYFEGNHEHRFRRAGSVPQELRRVLDPKRWLKIRERKLKWVPYSSRDKDLYRIGNLTFIHGFSAALSAGRKEAQRFGHCVSGHTHRPGIAGAEGTGGPFYNYNVGCLCDIDAMEYAFVRGMPGWQKGFGFGYVKKSGSYTFNVVIMNGKEITIEGKQYKL